MQFLKNRHKIDTKKGQIQSAGVHCGCGMCLCERDRMMRATRSDVAKLAGVSTATVSYVLNGSRHMSEKTRKRVLEAVEQLNYKPDMIARSMTKNETRQLSFMINNAANPFYGEIINGFENAAMERGYFVNLCTGNKNINDYFDNYVARRVDGVFIAAIPYKFDMEKLYSLTDNGIRVIVSGIVDVDLRRVNSIENDYVSAMDKAIRYLYELGHREIAYLSGLNRNSRFDLRADGYLSAVEKYHLPCGADLLLDGKPPYSTEISDGYRMANELLQSGRKFTAAICTNDLMAMGAISVFKEAGLRVPEDVSVMGFDDILFSQAWRPGITTMGGAKSAFGRKAFELLHASIRHGTTGYYLNQLEVVKRASTAPPPR